MTKDDFDKIGLGFIDRVNYSIIVVKDWEKFFPQINLPTEGPLVKLAKRSWFTLITFYDHHAADFNISIRGTNALYYKNRHRLDITETTEKDFLEVYCPYSVNDMRRYAWLSILNQFDYVKICNDIQETITNIIEVKND